MSRRFTRDPEVVRRVLVRAPNWVGDAVMSLPVLAGLKRLFPLAEITVLAAPRVAPLFAVQPGVTEIIRYPSGRGKWQVLWELRGRFDVALALPNSMESALGLWLVGVPSRVGYNTDARRLFLKEAVSGHEALAGLHTVFYLLGLLKALGGVATFTPPTLYLEPEEEAMGAQLLAEADLPGQGPWVGLSPGAAYGPAKRWRPSASPPWAGNCSGSSGPAWSFWGATTNVRWPMRSKSSSRRRWWIWWAGPACGRPWGCCPNSSFWSPTTRG